MLVTTLPTLLRSSDSTTAKMMFLHPDTLPTQYNPIPSSNLSTHHDQVTHRIPDVDTLDDSAYCQQFSPNNISYLNISCESDLNYSIPLYGYCSPFLLLTTVVANTLIILVLSKRTMTSPTNLVLMGEWKRRNGIQKQTHTSRTLLNFHALRSFI